MTISLKELLKVMSAETYRTLKARGKIELAKSAPNAEVSLESLPPEYRRRFQSEMSDQEKGAEHELDNTKVVESGSLMILSSIGSCRKALDFQAEAGVSTSMTVMLDGRKQTCEAQPANGMPTFRGHQLILRDENTLVCRLCGRKFRSVHRELTAVERYEFESLLPTTPFVR